MHYDNECIVIDVTNGGHKVMDLTAVYIQVPEGYIAFVEELPGANTQGDTLDEARENLREAVTLVIEANRELTARSLVGQSVVREPLGLPQHEAHRPGAAFGGTRLLPAAGRQEA